MKANLLKGKMAEKELSADNVADKIGMPRSTFYYKLSGQSQFTTGEAKKVALALQLSATDIMDIFFA